MYGALANANVYRFSSKEWNGNSGLYYYLYRFYDPNLQRWVNRDPLGEMGGINLIQFCKNNPISYIDSFGNDPGTIIEALFPPSLGAPPQGIDCTMKSAHYVTPVGPPQPGQTQRRKACVYTCEGFFGETHILPKDVTVYVNCNSACPTPDSVAEGDPRPPRSAAPNYGQHSPQVPKRW
jgi:RHS repeat-associated protein